MKKQAYIAPAIMVQKIELQKMIAESGPQQVYSDPSNGISDEGSILSRRSSSFWDDEE